MRLHVSRLNRNNRTGGCVWRNSGKRIDFGGVGESARAVSPDVIGFAAVHAKALLFATGFFCVGKGTLGSGAGK